MGKKTNINKKNIINVAMIIGLVALIVGITYAIIIYTGESSDNTVKTGQISMSYTEPTNALVIENALPISDLEGKVQNQYFEFTVKSSATTNANDNTGIEITI